MASETIDALLGGRLTITQPATGYRVNVDTLLLAAGVMAPAGGRGLEIGCGVGGALLAAALALPDADFVGVEQDPASAAYAVRNAQANQLDHRVAVRVGDGLEIGPTDENSYDIAFANPPFFDPNAIRAPHPDRRAALVATRPVEAWVKALAKAARPGGRILMLHRAERLAEILAACAGRVGEIAILGIHARAHDPATRVLVAGIKGSRGPIRLSPGLILHEGECWTDTAEHLISGVQRITELWRRP